MKGKGAMSLVVKRLSVALFISGAMNVVLMVCLAQGPVTVKVPDEAKAVVTAESGVQGVYGQYRQMTFEQLKERLKDSGVAVGRYRHRDVALGCLVEWHHFDLGRALRGHERPTRKKIFMGNRPEEKLTVFSGVTEALYEVVEEFLAKETWPLTSYGLFLKMKALEEKTPQSLAEAFYLTPEFLTLEMLMKRTGGALPRGELRRLICGADWVTVRGWALKERERPDYTPAMRGEFLASLGVDIKEAVVEEKPLEVDDIYVVQEGDSYWKIAKRFHVDVGALKGHNHRSNDTLRPGMTLRIP